MQVLKRALLAESPLYDLKNKKEPVRGIPGGKLNSAKSRKAHGCALPEA